MILHNLSNKSKEEYREQLFDIIPSHMIEGLYNFVELGLEPGGFLTAILCNNLSEAFNRADEKNRDCMENWVQVMTWSIPGCCHGSVEAVKEWMAKKRKEKNGS